ncbi:hypothetical protein [Actinokineospora bangkokensis]|uniref:Uncharacterized protein n=1 Tax=Actinokineospora bangkokensis TaxID=1193682 RepID=A0A1Q9LM18_9PSEU|nr:hypothetical protein [Actinokineospora bangkokensis]OLR93078.1 hypothetical protein BJP25_19210 [Actinokineospora bangkokensis]
MDHPDTAAAAGAGFGLDLITDPDFAARFGADVLRALGATTPAAQGDWAGWLAGVDARLGPGLRAAVLPGTGPDRPEPASRPVTASARDAWRRWAERWRAELSPGAPVEVRLTAAHLHVELLAAGVWGEDESWREVLGELVTALVPTDAEQAALPGRALDHVSSLLAVGLALLFQDATLHGSSGADLVIRRTWDAAGEWPAFADPAVVAHYLRTPSQPYARVPTEAGVDAVVELAQTAPDDPDATLTAAFEAEGLDVQRFDGVWVTEGTANSRRLAARIVDIAGTRAAALARTTAKSTVILRVDRTLVLGESNPKLWRTFQLSPVGTAVSTLCQGELPTARSKHPLSPIPPAVAELAETLGVNPTMLAAALR